MFKYLYEENYMKSNMQFYKTTLVSVVIIFMLTGTAGAVPFACITNNVDGIITAIDTSNNSVKATIKVGSYPTGVAATADETMINAGDATWINEELKKNTGGKYTIPAGKYTVSGQIKIPENTVLQGTISESGKLLSTIYICLLYTSLIIQVCVLILETFNNLLIFLFLIVL